MMPITKLEAINLKVGDYILVEEWHLSHKDPPWKPGIGKIILVHPIEYENDVELWVEVSTTLLPPSGWKINASDKQFRNNIERDDLYLFYPSEVLAVVPESIINKGIEVVHLHCALLGVKDYEDLRLLL